MAFSMKDIGFFCATASQRGGSWSDDSAACAWNGRPGGGGFRETWKGLLSAGALPVLEGGTEKVEDVAGGEGFLGEVGLLKGDFRAAAAEPGAQGGRFNGRVTCGEAGGYDTGEDITLSSCGHAGGAGGIAPERLPLTGDEAAAAFQQERGGKAVGKLSRGGFAG